MDDSPFEGLSSLVKVSGHNVPARARFIGEAIVASTLGGLTLGLVCGQAGAISGRIGPLVPFMLGTWTGYSVGMYGYWRNCRRVARKYAKRYPKIMAHALYVEHDIIVPPSVVQASAETQNGHVDYSALVNPKGINPLQVWIDEGGLRRISLSVLAAQSCRPDVEELERQQRQRLVEEYQEQMRGES